MGEERKCIESIIERGSEERGGSTRNAEWSKHKRGKKQTTGRIIVRKTGIKESRR